MLKFLSVILVLVNMVLPGRDTEEGKVYLVPIGSGIDPELVHELKVELEKEFKVPFLIGSGFELPRTAYVAPRNQYYSPAILSLLKRRFPEDSTRAIGIVDFDLWVPGLNFIFGEADPAAGVAVISLTRLRQEFYHLSPDPELFFSRALKEAVHEVGHTYGLPHCPDPDCVMHFSNSIADTDRKSAHFCSRCRRSLKKSLEGEKSP
jgi:archaemetzincin